MTEKLNTSQDLKEFFYERVREAIHQQTLSLSAHAEFYLVDILTRFSLSENFFTIDEQGRVEDRPLALKLYDATFTDQQKEKFRHLKTMGDTALYRAGVFYEGLQTATVDVGYYINMGGMAYQTLSNMTTHHERDVSKLFGELSSNFSNLVEVLCLSVEREVTPTDKDVLQLIDRYRRTGSLRAKELLTKLGIDPDAIALNEKNTVN